MSKTHILHFRADDEQYNLILKNMNFCNIENLSGYLLKMAVDGMVIKLEMPELKELLTLLQRYGNNLNQIAKRLNEGKSIYADDVKDMQEKQNEIYKMTKVLYLKLLNL